jgi:glycosidase
MEKLPISLLALVLILAILFASCKSSEKKELKPFVSEVTHPEWTKDAVIYEVNVRQYTPEGTFQAFSEHLPRLKELGIDILWLMPTFPIGEVNRKGALGSYYSVKDFMDVNPQYGTMEDFKNLVGKIHELGMYVILDWVPNHSAWDNPLTAEHPEFYAKDSLGKFTPPIGTDWTDVIQLDWNQKGLHDYMIEAMSFWVKMGVDGFRVDHPHNTPKEFWERARTELYQIKPVFMLAEHEGPANFMEKGFDMNYAWEMHHLMKRVAQGKDSSDAISKYFEREWAVYPQNVYRLMFLTNHDENSWAGTIDTLFPASQKTFATLIFTAAGMPLLYSGQEVCLNKRLRFFSRDTISWDTCSMTKFYTDLISLKKQNPALWNGESGGKMERISTNRDNKVFAFSRSKEENRILVFLNLSKKNITVKPVWTGYEGEYKEFFSGEIHTIYPESELNLEPWGYRVFIR